MGFFFFAAHLFIRIQQAMSLDGRQACGIGFTHNSIARCTGCLDPSDSQLGIFLEATAHCQMIVNLCSDVGSLAERPEEEEEEERAIG